VVASGGSGGDDDDDAEFESVWPAIAARRTAAEHIVAGASQLPDGAAVPRELPPPPPPVRYCFIGGEKHVWTQDCDDEGGRHDDCCCGDEDHAGLFD
jgi:hypothetical protein